MGFLARLKRIFRKDLAEPAERQRTVPHVQRTVKRRQIPKYVVGLDWGTHSTKLAVRRRGEHHAELLTVPHWEAPLEGYPWFAEPSLVAVNDGQLLFGQDAMGVGRRALLKVDLLNDLPESQDPDLGPESADVLASAYLAWAFGLALEKIRLDVGSPNFEVFLNAGVPLAYLDPDVTRKNRFLRAVQVAWDANLEPDGTSPRQGTRRDEWHAFAKPRLRPDCVIPGAEERRFNVMPECVAAVVALDRDPHWEKGVYTTIDIGAGTTEVAVVDIWGEPGDHRLGFYDSATLDVGASLLKKALRGDANGSTFYELMNVIRRAYWQAWGTGFRSNAGGSGVGDTWRLNHVIKMGGGWDVTGVTQHIARKSPVSMKFQGRGTTRLLPFTPSPEAIRTGRFASKLDEFPDSHMRYSAVVLGLTIHPMEWPPWYQPHELEPIEPIPHTPRERNSMADW